MLLVPLILAAAGWLCEAEGSAGNAVEYIAVCDAGSTGTRLYVFSLDIARAEAKAVFVKKIKPGLSSYAENPDAAVPPLLKLLIEGAEQVPRALRSKTTLAIFGTAGMRLLTQEKQDRIWEAVTSGVRSCPTCPFASDGFQARTISGNEEGLWAVYNANYLAGRMSHDLRSRGKAAPLGLMDLGGSSTQIAIPASSAASQGAHLGKGALVHSYLGFGMTHIREQVRKNAKGAEDGVCYMRGAPIEGDLVGTGDAEACRKLIRDITSTHSRTCQTSAHSEKPCLGDLAQVPEAVEAIKGKADFYAVAGMTYVVDFVHWWLGWNPDAAKGTEPFRSAYPRPSLAELTVAVDRVCAGDYKPVESMTADKEKAHAFTRFDNAPFRCFQANYILVLLGDMYSFQMDGRSVSFLLDVDGEELEWPLGSALAQRASSKGIDDEL